VQFSAGKPDSRNSDATNPARPVTVLLHGGVGGAIVEALVVVAIIGLAVAVWLRERKTQERK
jgi:hypothetical protein